MQPGASAQIWLAPAETMKSEELCSDSYTRSSMLHSLSYSESLQQLQDVQ